LEWNGALSTFSTTAAISALGIDEDIYFKACLLNMQFSDIMEFQGFFFLMDSGDFKIPCNMV
jgi:hypothetical protein